MLVRTCSSLTPCSPRRRCVPFALFLGQLDECPRYAPGKESKEETRKHEGKGKRRKGKNMCPTCV
eukprot:1159938-Pelagomonas_calceolata.AAC.1